MEQKMKYRELVWKLREEYPKMSRQLLCVGMKPKLYGVQLTAKAKQICGFSVKRTENRTNPCRISCRLSESEFEAFKRQLELSGMRMNDFVKKAVMEYVCKQDGC